MKACGFEGFLRKSIHLIHDFERLMSGLMWKVPMEGIIEDFTIVTMKLAQTEMTHPVIRLPNNRLTVICSAKNRTGWHRKLQVNTRTLLLATREDMGVEYITLGRLRPALAFIPFRDLASPPPPPLVPGVVFALIAARQPPILAGWYAA